MTFDSQREAEKLARRLSSPVGGPDSSLEVFRGHWKYFLGFSDRSNKG